MRINLSTKAAFLTHNFQITFKYFTSFITQFYNLKHVYWNLLTRKLQQIVLLRRNFCGNFLINMRMWVMCVAITAAQRRGIKLTKDLHVCIGILSKTDPTDAHNCSTFPRLLFKTPFFYIAPQMFNGI